MPLITTNEAPLIVATRDQYWTIIFRGRQRAMIDAGMDEDWVQLVVDVARAISHEHGVTEVHLQCTPAEHALFTRLATPYMTSLFTI